MKKQDLYYEVLDQVQTGGMKIRCRKYLLGTILSACKDFTDRFALVETKLPAMETVRRAIMEKDVLLMKQDIRELCLSLSISSIEGALRKLVVAGGLKREGQGRSSAITAQNNLLDR